MKTGSFWDSFEMARLIIKEEIGQALIWWGLRFLDPDRRAGISTAFLRYLESSISGIVSPEDDASLLPSDFSTSAAASARLRMAAAEREWINASIRTAILKAFPDSEKYDASVLDRDEKFAALQEARGKVRVFENRAGAGAA